MRTNKKIRQRKGKIKLEANGELWRRVSSLNDSTPDEKHYVVRMGDDGTAVIILRVPSSKGFSFGSWLTIHRPIVG